MTMGSTSAVVGNGDNIGIELCLKDFEGQFVWLAGDERELWSGESNDRCGVGHAVELGVRLNTEDVDANEHMVDGREDRTKVWWKCVLLY